MELPPVLHIDLIQKQQNSSEIPWGCYCGQFLQASNQQASVCVATVRFLDLPMAGDSHKHGSNLCQQDHQARAPWDPLGMVPTSNQKEICRNQEIIGQLR